MPTAVMKKKTGYKVCEKKRPWKCHSKQAMTKEKAAKQQAAIAISRKSKMKKM